MRHKRLPPPNSLHEPCVPPSESKEDPPDQFLLTEEAANRLRMLFMAKPRRMISTALPQSIYYSLQYHPRGVSGAFEDAIQGFNGDLEALLQAAAESVEHRKRVAPEDPTHTVSGRVGLETFAKLEKIQKGLSEIRGASRTRIMAGLIQLRFSSKQP